MQYIVGMTGLIGSGKSVAGDIFRELGIDVIDTDEIAHRITAKDGIAILPIIEKFGQEFINSNGELDRVKLRELVFNDASKRQSLEKILHPLIYIETIKEIKKAKSKYVIVMVPLLFKSLKYIGLIHRGVFIDCDESILIQRVKKRSGMSEQEIRNILKIQMPKRLQVILSDDCLYNNGSISDLKEQIIKLNKIYQKHFVTG